MHLWDLVVYRGSPVETAGLGAGPVAGQASGSARGVLSGARGPPGVCCPGPEARPALCFFVNPAPFEKILRCAQDDTFSPVMLRSFNDEASSFLSF